MTTLLQDLEYGPRALARKPNFTARGRYQLRLGSNIKRRLKQDR
jgi:hypothetical protein